MSTAALFLVAPLVLAAWAPTARPLLAATVEASLDPATPISRQRVVQLLEQAVPSHIQVRDLSVTALSHCGGKLDCRLELAHAAGSPVLLVLYATGDAEHLSLDLEVLSSTIAAGAEGSRIYEVAEPWSVRPPELFPSDDLVRAWLRGAVAPVLTRPEYAQPTRVRLTGLLPGSILISGAASIITDTEEQEILIYGAQALDLQVQAQDYEPFGLTVDPRSTEVSLADRLVPPDVRRVRRVVFWSSVAASVAGTALVAAAATRPKPLCIHLDTPEVCPDAVFPGVSDTGLDLTLPVAAGLVAVGLPGIVAGTWDLSAEADFRWLLGGLALGAAVSGTLLAVGGASP